MLRIRGTVSGVAVAVALAGVAGVAVGGATASLPSPSGPFQTLGSYDGAGNPEPSVEVFPDGTQNDMHWSICLPGSSMCSPLASKDGAANPGPQPAGTVFDFTGTYAGKTYTSSLRWRGRLQVTTPPQIHGQIRFGRTLTSTAAVWSGGWGTEFDQLGIEACRTTMGTGCVMLSGDEFSCSRAGCGSRGGVAFSRPDRARIGNWYSGWYLFALDAHRADSLSLLVGYASPAAIPPWPRNPMVARSHPYGPIVGPPRPIVRFLRNAQNDRNKVIVASVHCAVTCHVRASVELPRSRWVSGEQTLWTSSMTILGTSLVSVKGRIPCGPLLASMTVDDSPYLSARLIAK